eukprot:Nk52_evm7s288 gene=Nk52_evmTU7s288
MLKRIVSGSTRTLCLVGKRTRALHNVSSSSLSSVSCAYRSRSPCNPYVFGSARHYGMKPGKGASLLSSGKDAGSGSFGFASPALMLGCGAALFGGGYVYTWQLSDADMEDFCSEVDVNEAVNMEEGGPDIDPAKRVSRLHNIFTVYAEEDISEEAEKKVRKFRDSKVLNYENRIRFMSNPDKVFRYFATREIDGEIFMTPEDFVRSVIPGELQPDGLGLDQFKKLDPEAVKKRFDKVNDATDGPLLERFGKTGLISFSEYVFLLTVLATSPRRFEIAFKMFDLDGNGWVDIGEFQTVQGVIRTQTNSGKRARSTVSEPTNAIEKSAVLRVLFGKKGDRKLTYEEFSRFISEFQREILEQEYNRYVADEEGENQLSCSGFANVLLSYGNLKDTKTFKTRAKRVKKNLKGKFIDFKSFLDFNEFLKNIDDVEMSLQMYTAAGESINKEDFKRAAVAVSNIKLNDIVVDTVFDLFDNDGDGKLHNREFISFMKARIKRGTESHRDTGFTRGLKGLLICMKEKMETMAE